MSKSILLPIDIGHADSSAGALAEAVEQARSRDATLHLLTVIPDFGMAVVGSFFPKGYEDRAEREAAEALQRYAAENLPEDVRHALHVRHGTIYKEIVAAANELEVELVVMASHRPEMKDYFLGPNAARVVRHARQSVLVVR